MNIDAIEVIEVEQTVLYLQEPLKILYFYPVASVFLELTVLNDDMILVLRESKHLLLGVMA